MNEYSAREALRMTIHRTEMAAYDMHQQAVAARDAGDNLTALRLKGQLEGVGVVVGFLDEELDNSIAGALEKLVNPERDHE